MEYIIEEALYVLLYDLFIAPGKNYACVVERLRLKIVDRLMAGRAKVLSGYAEGSFDLKRIAVPAFRYCKKVAGQIFFRAEA